MKYRVTARCRNAGALGVRHLRREYTIEAPDEMEAKRRCIDMVHAEGFEPDAFGGISAREVSAPQMSGSAPGSRHGWWYQDCPDHGKTPHLSVIGGRCEVCAKAQETDTDA